MIVLILFVMAIAWVVAEAIKDSPSEKSKEASSSTSERESFETGGKKFEFRYKKISQSEWGIWADKYPPIEKKNRSRSPHRTHVYSDGRISVLKAPKTLDQAKAIARYWATGFVAYLNTGMFPDSGGMVKV